VCSSEFNEQLVYQMLTDGHYRKYVERLRGRLEQATAATLRMVERVGMEVYMEPKGGVFLWARPPGIDDVAGIASAAAEAGIMLAPGKVFRPQMQASPWLRLNVAFATHPGLERFLGEALERSNWKSEVTQAGSLASCSAPALQQTAARYTQRSWSKN
jgi:DNA-binding transcriptional MocR family regulator